MFGYIRIDKGELKVREYEAYKSAYCGLCKQMGRDYSFLSRLTLSYDCTFYAVFLMAITRSCEGFEKGRCRFNPLKRCTYCKGGEAMSKAAALSVILSYYKVVDDIRDGGFFKRTLCKIIKPLFSRWRKKARKRYPELDRLAEKMICDQWSAEENPSCPLDLAAEPTAAMLASALELDATDETERRLYRQIGYGLGRFIYLADAADDLSDDMKKGGFNPFIQFGDEADEVIGANLSQALATVFDAYNFLEIIDFKGIIDNIILMGLPRVQEEIISKRKEGKR